jgi:hypothetical protein
MEDEIEVIGKNRTWKLIDRPQDRNYWCEMDLQSEVQCRWVGSKKQSKLVAKGYSQQLGVDFHETFAPEARLDTVRALISLAAQKGWLLYQLDVKSAFLNGELKEEVYVEQPQGFVIQGEEEKVYKLRKALYGLKQALRAWYIHIDNYFNESGFKRSKSELTLYVKHQGNVDLLIVALYIDDLILTGSNAEMIEEFKKDMVNKYEMSDMGLLHYFLGIEVYQDKEGVFISQRMYAEKILRKFRMVGCKPMATPLAVNEKLKKEDGGKKVDATLYRSLVGNLLYLTATRPEVMFAASLLSRFMHSPSHFHFATAKRVLRYIQGTTCYGIRYCRNSLVK